MKKLMWAAMVAALSTTLLAASASAAVKVQQSGDAGWTFNPDLSNATPYAMSLAQHSTGVGSLFVAPISTPAAKKFIAAKALGIPVASVTSVAYDFLIAGNGTALSGSKFYANVLANLPGSTTFYDCRFDYSPLTGSTTAFTTASFGPTSTPVGLGDRPDAFVCPPTLAGMPEGSTISAVVLNVGDTSLSDIGLAGYLDNVVVSTTDGSTADDFEPLADACKKNGYKVGGFKNQGACVSAIQSS